MGEPLTSSTTAEETPPPAPRPSASSNMVTAIPAGTGQQQFCLRWNNYQSNLCSVFDQLLHAESFVDVTLACQGSKFIKCHRVVLSACSPYFQNLLLEHPVSHPIIILRDLQYPELQALVEFMYKGEINVLQEQIPRLLKTAEILRIRGLAEVKNDEDLKPSVGSVSNSSSSPQNSRRPVPIAPSPYPPHPSNEASRRNGVLPSSSTPPLTKRMRLDSSTVPSPLGNLFMLPPTGPHIGNPMFVGSGSNIHTSARSLEDEIKPGIAEMIKEEERARMMESAVSMANRGDGSPFSIDPMQYQVNSMWQKAWAQNQMTNYRFRERGPLKTWKPDTMAAAIKAVLNDGLSLSQAARSHDIPYPTFVLYANRVNNQLGPPPEGQGPAEIRHKGRGRPQRILLGTWPPEKVDAVIKAVVYREGNDSSNYPSASATPPSPAVSESPYPSWARPPSPLDSSRSSNTNLSSRSPEQHRQERSVDEVVSELRRKSGLQIISAASLSKNSKASEDSSWNQREREKNNNNCDVGEVVVTIPSDDIDEPTNNPPQAPEEISLSDGEEDLPSPIEPTVELSLQDDVDEPTPVEPFVVKSRTGSSVDQVLDDSCSASTPSPPPEACPDEAL